MHRYDMGSCIQFMDNHQRYIDNNLLQIYVNFKLQSISCAWNVCLGESYTNELI